MIDYFYIRVTKPGRYYLSREINPNLNVIEIDQAYYKNIKEVVLWDSE